MSDPFNPELTIYDNWLENVNTISGLNLSEPDVGMPGSGSDYLAFLDHLGVASMDILFGGDYGVYHSNYGRLRNSLACDLRMYCWVRMLRV